MLVDPPHVDPRGVRFSATVTTVVLAVVVLVSGAVFALVLLGFQALVFAIGVARGSQSTPYGWLFRILVRPRLAPAVEFEDAPPPRFAQAVGLVFAVTGWLALVGGAVALGSVIVAFALTAAFLNAAFNFCLGCEVYLLIRRATPVPRVSATPRSSLQLSTTQLGKETS